MTGVATEEAIIVALRKAPFCSFKAVVLFMKYILLSHCQLTIYNYMQFCHVYMTIFGSSYSLFSSSIDVHDTLL